MHPEPDNKFKKKKSSKNFMFSARIGQKKVKKNIYFFNFFFFHVKSHAIDEIVVTWHPLASGIDETVVDWLTMG